MKNKEKHKLKPKRDTPLKPSRTARIKKSDNKCWWECGKIGTVIHFWRWCKIWQVTMENSLLVTKIVKYRTLIWPINSTHRCISKIIKSIYSNNNLHRNIHCNIIHNSKRVKTTQVPLTDELINKCGVCVCK